MIKCNKCGGNTIRKVSGKCQSCRREDKLLDDGGLMLSSYVTGGQDAERRFKATLARYGLTLDEYRALRLSQADRCPICLRPLNRLERIVIDHNHDTGKVRGVLCGKCNVALGMAGENISNIQRMIDYLEKHNGE